MSHDKKGPITSLKENFERLDGECNKLKEDYLRSLADFDNYRRRVERDMDVSRRQALESLVLDLLPVVDNFDRAVQVAPTGKDEESVRKGMMLIHRQLRDVLCKHGLEEYSCVGQEFDPRRAEAIGYAPADAGAPNTVVSEVCKGFACGERVLRPARVIVAKSPAVEPDEAAAADE